MSILNTILQAQGGDLVSKLADNFGVDSLSAAKAIGGMTPALANGLKQNLGSGDALSAILGAATSGGFDKYLDSSGDLLSGGLGDGANILGSLLGGESGIASVAAKRSRGERNRRFHRVPPCFLPWRAWLWERSQSKPQVAAGLRDCCLAVVSASSPRYSTLMVTGR